MASQSTNETAAVGETVLPLLTPAVKLRSMDGRAASRTIAARRLLGSGGRAATLTGCNSFVQPRQPVKTLAGITDTSGRPLAPELVYRVEVVIFDPTDSETELYHETIPPSEVLSRTWTPWPEDVIGYNFEHEVDGRFFELGGERYALVYFLYLNGVETAFRVENTVFVHAVGQSRTW